MDTKDRLLEFLKYLGISQSTFEKNVGISNGYINNIRKSIGGNVLNKILITYPELNKIWLLHGDGSMLKNSEGVQQKHIEVDKIKSNHILLRMALKNGKKAIPVTNIKGSGGQIVVYNDEPEIILEYIEAPFLKDADGVIEVQGHSMYPKYPNGCRLSIKILEQKKINK